MAKVRPHVVLTRYAQGFATDRDGTPGKILTPSGLHLYTGELPWRNDAKDKSCVPPGLEPGASVVYLAEFLDSPRFKQKLYHLTKRLQADGSWGPLPDGRLVVEMHNGNLFGDADQGALAQVEGCILLGNALGTFPTGQAYKCADGVTRKLLKPQLAVMNSVDALKRFEDDLGRVPFELEVRRGTEAYC